MVEQVEVKYVGGDPDRLGVITCPFCGQKFRPKSRTKPIRCSICRKRYWVRIVAKYKTKCGHCGFDWESRVLNPKECPACKQYLFKAAERTPLIKSEARQA